MARNKGIKFWDDLVGIFESKSELTDKAYAKLDSIEGGLKTNDDKRIMTFLDILIENGEQKESYFRDDLLNYAKGVYKGYTDEQIMKGVKES